VNHSSAEHDYLKKIGFRKGQKRVVLLRVARAPVDIACIRRIGVIISQTLAALLPFAELFNQIPSQQFSALCNANGAAYREDEIEKTVGAQTDENHGKDFRSIRGGSGIISDRRDRPNHIKVSVKPVDAFINVSVDYPTEDEEERKLYNCHHG
jgi:hypothetical protein